MRITSLILIWVMAVTMFFSACSKNNFVKAYNTSKNISGLVKTAATTIGDLYTAKIISYDAKEALINKLRFVQSNNENLFLKEIDATWEQYKTKPPKGVLSHLDIIFSQQIVAPFVELLNYAGVLSPEGNIKVMAAVAILKAAIFSIATIFGTSMAQLKLGPSKSLKAIEKFAI